MRRRLIAELRHEVAAWAVAPIHVSLYGSVARGEGSLESDIDVLVVRPVLSGDSEHDRWDDQLYATGTRIERVSGNPLSWFDIDEAAFRRGVQSGERL